MSTNTTAPKEEEPEFVGPIALFCLMITLLFGALFDKVRTYGIPIPSSLGMIVYGAILGGIAMADPHWRRTLVLVDFNPDLILHIFLPVLIFDGSAGLKQKVLSRLTANAIYLAGPGVVMGAFAVAGLGVGIYEEWSFLQSLLLGAVVSATDPVAVIAVLHDLDADPFVTVLVDSEAIMNDGSAIVLYQIVLKAIETGVDQLTAGGVIGSIFRLAVLPIPLGIAFGIVIHWLSLRSLTQPLISGTIQISGAYIMFYIADHLVKTSGVLTVMCAGFYIARQRGRHPRSDEEDSVRAVWSQLVWMGNTLLFALVGFLIIVRTSTGVEFGANPGWQVGRIFILFIFLNVYRAFMVLTAIPVINYTAELPEDTLTWERFIMLSAGGLRGGIAMVLGLAVLGKSDLFTHAFGAEFFFNVAGIVVLTCFLNGWLASPLVNALRLNSKEIFSFYALRLAVQELKHNMNTSIEQLKKGAPLTPHQVVNWVFVRFMSVNRVENLGLEIEHEAKAHGTLSEKHSHIDAAVDAAMTGKARLDKEGEEGADGAAKTGASPLITVGTMATLGTAAGGNEGEGDAKTPTNADSSNPEQQRRQQQQTNQTTTATATAQKASSHHERSQQIKDDASCSVFIYCKRCCAGSSDGDDDLDTELEEVLASKKSKEKGGEDYRKQRPVGVNVNETIGNLFNLDEDSFEDDDQDLSYEDEQAEGGVAARDDAEQQEQIGSGKSDIEGIVPSRKRNNKNNKNNSANISNEPTNDEQGGNERSSRTNRDSALDRAKRGGSRSSSSSLQHRVLSEFGAIKNAELKTLKIVELLNQSRERHLMTPIVLRMIKRDLWRQYNAGLLTGTTVTAFADFIDARTRTGRLFTTEDVFHFIKGESNLTIYDKVERLILPQWFEESRNHYLVEAAVAFRTMMEHVKRTLPLLQAKQSNIIYWMGWAKLVHSCAVEHERATFEQFPELAVLINSRRTAQAVIAQAKEIIPQAAATYGLSSHQKQELNDKLFEFAYDALVVKEDESIIHRIRQDAIRAGDASMQEQQEEDDGAQQQGTGDQGAAKPQFDANGHPIFFRRTKIDADAAHGKQLVELLRNTSIFFSASDEVLAEIIDRSHAQLYSEHEPIVASHHTGFIIYGNISRLATLGGVRNTGNRKTKRFHSSDFFGINVLIFAIGDRSVHYVANEETHILWIPHDVVNKCMQKDPRVRHHLIISSALDVVMPILNRAYPFSALTTAQRRSIVTQAKVTRINDSRRFTEFGHRDAVFILRGKEVMPPNANAARILYEENSHIHDKDPLTLAVAPFITMLPEGYNGFFEEGSILVQLHDARLTSQRVPLTGMTVIDIANISLDVAWTSFTETAKQKDAFFATDALLQELHKYMHVCAGLNKVINKMIASGIELGGFRRTQSIAFTGPLDFSKSGLPASCEVVAADRDEALDAASATSASGNASPILPISAVTGEAEALSSVRRESAGRVSNSTLQQPQQPHHASRAAEEALNALAVVDEGDAILVVRDCIDELAQHIRIWSLQRHTGNLNRLYVSHVLSAFFSLVVRRSDQWAPRVRQFVEEHAKIDAATSATLGKAKAAAAAVVVVDQANPCPRNADGSVPSVDWCDMDWFCSNADLVGFMRGNAWYTDDDLKTLNGWDRLNVEGNVAAHVDIDEPQPALISATLHDAENRNAIFHAKSRARLVSAALRDLPADAQDVLKKQRLFGRARVQVSKGRSLPGGTSGHDVVAPVAQSERAGDHGKDTPSSGSDVSERHANVASERSASEFYNPDRYSG